MEDSYFDKFVDNVTNKLIPEEQISFISNNHKITLSQIINS